jgi:hypothetical protein
MSEDHTFTDEEAGELAGLLWDHEDTLADLPSDHPAKTTVKMLHDRLAEWADEKGVTLPAQRGGTPKGENNPPPPPGGG